MNYKMVKKRTLSPLIDSQGHVIPGSLRVKEYTDINQCRQGIIIESEKPGKPVLLFIHGGPGLPAYPLMKKGGLRLEKYFTVCYWDQRGTGMSFVKKGWTRKSYRGAIAGRHDCSNGLFTRQISTGKDIFICTFMGDLFWQLLQQADIQSDTMPISALGRLAIK
ncbi:alpha/beta hydrolase [Virgibacillus halophilus]|uniref:Alpha/beta hydrolase n=1 Tax=Tigheibacillus halophilus TaxID=361280 RepID=A0ABU5CBD7_9BACI|nr:alpha/beta hydrolase [Virgibacillus halophilus]